jgi:lycopene beta-cyclase
MRRVVIAGGGLAGGLAALALAAQRSDVQLLVVEQGEVFGGNHTWSFFDSDVKPNHHWVLQPISASHWPDHEIRFPRRRRILPVGYNSIRSSALDVAIKSVLRPDQYRLEASIAEVLPTHLLLASGERIEADVVIDARGPSFMPGQELGWQKFVGRTLRFAQEHKVPRPVIMDATVAQHDGYRFLYYLPVSPTELLLEDTYYSLSSSIDREQLSARLDQAAAELSCGQAEVVAEESGALPVVMKGNFAALWPADDPVPRLGLRGGFFHPTTSYSLPDAVANAAWLVEQSDFTAAALSPSLRMRAERNWRNRGFFELLNRMLFSATDPDQSYRVLEHFYRLPPGLIARFYAADLSLLDKARILSGRPPVPIGRALSILTGRLT